MSAAEVFFMVCGMLLIVVLTVGYVFAREFLYEKHQIAKAMRSRERQDAA